MDSIAESQSKFDTERWIVRVVTVAMLLVLAVVGGYKYMDYRQSRIIATGSSDPGCSLEQAACQATAVGGLSATLALEPRPIVATVPTSISLELEGLEATEARLDLSEEGTTTSLNPITLHRSSNGRFEGSVTIPVCCALDLSPWNAELLVTTAEGRVSFPFRFLLKTPPNLIAPEVP